MSEREALRALPSILLRTGYTDALAPFGALNFRRRDLAARLQHLAPRARTMVELWWLERPVPRTALTDTDLAVDALVAAGVLVEDAGQVRALCVALPLFGQVVLLPPPSDPGSVPYGPESLALAVRAGPPRPGRCLDLCTGSGIQALRLASGGSRVVAVEIDEAGSAWARRNVIMCSLEDRVEVRTGDLWDVAGDEPYDYIVSNPPIGFIPAQLDLHVHAGGIDGFAISRRILERLPTMLASEGAAQLASGCLGTETSLQVLDELPALFADASMRVALTVTSRHHLIAGDPVFAQLVAMFEASSTPPRPGVPEMLAAHLRSLGKTHFYRYTLVASRGGSGLDVQLTRFDRAGGAGFHVV